MRRAPTTRVVPMSNQKVPMPTTNVVQPKPVMLPPTATPVALTFCGASFLQTVQYDGSAVLAHEEVTGIAYHQASSRGGSRAIYLDFSSFWVPSLCAFELLPHSADRSSDDCNKGILSPLLESTCVASLGCREAGGEAFETSAVSRARRRSCRSTSTGLQGIQLSASLTMMVLSQPSNSRGLTCLPAMRS